ncbi:acyltransferase family protein [Kineococcus sp. SYSU DK004]|uniref:acyltransferase family protein n=1 Tax=Kineococcus sp. SYSU DK004 TaxID=3383125 RepID=UPI003D7D629C
MTVEGVRPRPGRESTGRAASTGGHGHEFHPDVEGLRAVALFLVFFSAAGVPRLSGGVIGVDAFFVISGFLITGLLVREVERTGTVSLARFYARRARRIIPSAAFVLTATLGAVLVLAPELARALARDVVAACLQVANWWLLVGDLDELSPQAAASPVKHYWTLAVEEQFYVLWPLLVIAVTALARRRGWPLRRSLFGALLGLSAVSLAVSALVTPAAELLGYLGTGSRAWQFGAGGLLALAAPRVVVACRAPGVRRAVVAAGWAGALALGTSALWVVSLPYPGTVALVPTLGAVAVIAAGCAGTGRGTVGSVLSHPVLRFCGRLSYVWYLWHLPVVHLAHEAGVPDAWRVNLVLAVLSGLPALATMLLVERPLRFSPLVARSDRRGLLTGLVATAVPLTLAAAVLVTT